MALEITITNEEKVKVTASPVTSTGKPASVDGAVVFTVQSGDATLEAVDDKSAFLVSGDTPGDSAILVTADADLGAGVENISDVIVLHVAGAKAVNLGLVADAPVAKS